MYLKIINTPLEGLDPESKYVLAAMARHLDICGLQSLARDQIAGLLGIPERVASKALVQLVSLEMLSKSMVRTAGEKLTSYQVSPRLISRLEKMDAARPTAFTQELLVGRAIDGRRIQAAGPDHEWTEDVFRNAKETLSGTEKPPLGRSGNLGLANSLLLAVLLSNADGFGCVDNLGRARLSRLTGLDITSLRQRLRRLVDLGFIRRYVPGVASPVFPTKLIGTFILNLNHRQLTYGKDVSSLLVHTAYQRDAIRYVHGIYVDLKEARRQRHWDISPTPTSVLRFLAKVQNGVLEQIGLLLCRYASALLSNCWHDLVPEAKFEFSDIRKKVRVDFQLPEADASDKKAMLDREEIFEFFYLLARDLAYECKSRFEQASGLSFLKLDFMLIPVHLSEGYESLALLVSSRDVASKPKCQLIDEDVDGATVKLLSSESEVPDDVRHACGALTLPKSAPESEVAAKAKAQAKFKAKVATERAAKLQEARKFLLPLPIL